MKKILKIAVLISTLLSALPIVKLCAQQTETQKNINNASAYLKRTASVEKYSGKFQKIQQRLLKKLQRKEAKNFRAGNRPYLSQNTNNNPTSKPPTNNALKDAFGGQQQTMYAGIMKRYKINSKKEGTILLGYNFLWQQEDSRSPFLLRFGLSQ